MPRKNPYSYPLMLKPFLAISVCQAGDCSCHQAWRKAGMFGRCDQSTSSLRGNQALLPCLWGTSATIVGQACVNVHAYMHVHNPNHGNIIGKDQCRKLRQFSFQSQMDLKGGAYIYIYIWKVATQLRWLHGLDFDFECRPIADLLYQRYPVVERCNGRRPWNLFWPGVGVLPTAEVGMSQSHLAKSYIRSGEVLLHILLGMDSFWFLHGCMTGTTCSPFTAPSLYLPPSA